MTRVVGLTRWGQGRRPTEFQDEIGFTLILEMREPAASRAGYALDR
jgi:hypothetical protein